MDSGKSDPKGGQPINASGGVLGGNPLCVSGLTRVIEAAKQIRGEAKAWWGKLTDDDLDRAAGKFDVLAGLLQQKYGYTRERAADEIDKRVTEYEASLKTKPAAAPVK